MISRSLKQAVGEFLRTNFASQFNSCEVRTVPPPGKPFGCIGPVAATIWDADVRFSSKIGHYPTNGCFITITCRTLGVPGDRLESFLDDKDGPNDIKDFTAAILDHSKYEIAAYANSLADMAPRGGAFNGILVAPLVMTVSSWEPKYADWFSEATLPVRAPSSEMQRIAGYAATIFFGDAKTLQTIESATG